MARDWFYSHDGKQFGPVPPTELRTLARSGRLGEKDKVWSEGMPSWVEAGTVPGLLRPKSVSGTAQPAVETNETPHPWDSEEPNAFNPTKRHGIGGAGCGFAVAILFVLIGIAADNEKPVGIAALVACMSLGTLMLSAPRFLGLTMRGRWVPTEDQQVWIELLSGNTFRRQNGSVGSYRLLKNHKFIDLMTPGGQPDRWKIVSHSDDTLVIQIGRGLSGPSKKQNDR